MTLFQRLRTLRNTKVPSVMYVSPCSVILRILQPVVPSRVPHSMRQRKTSDNSGLETWRREFWARADQSSSISLKCVYTVEKGGSHDLNRSLVEGFVIGGHPYTPFRNNIAQGPRLLLSSAISRTQTFGDLALSRIQPCECCKAWSHPSTAAVGEITASLFDPGHLDTVASSRGDHTL